jgi:hypothetical protein
VSQFMMLVGADISSWLCRAAAAKAIPNLVRSMAECVVETYVELLLTTGISVRRTSILSDCTLILGILPLV